MAPSSGPPPQASLTGIPPELRNSIHHLVGEEIDQVTIIGRKIHDPTNHTNATIFYEEIEAGERLWSTIAKHPLSQTCRQLRQDFDPIHRHKALVTKVSEYCLELENYDIDTMDECASLISQIPPLEQHLRGTYNKHYNRSGDLCKLKVNFQLNSYAPESVRKLEASPLHRAGYYALERLVIPGDRLRAEVILNFRNKEQPIASFKRWLTITQSAQAETKRALRKLWDHERAKPGSFRIYDDFTPSNNPSPYSEKYTLLETLYDHHKDAHSKYHERLRLEREAKEESDMRHRLLNEMRDVMRASLKDELRDDLRDGLRDELVAEIEQGMSMKIEHELRKKIEDEMREKIEAELKDRLGFPE